MNEILIDTLKPGMQFSQAVFLDDGENEFLPAFTAMTENEIELLKNQNMRVIYTDGEIVKNRTQSESVRSQYQQHEEKTPQYESIEKKSVAFSSIKKTQTYTEYALLIRDMQGIFDTVKRRERLSSTPVSKIEVKLSNLLNTHAELLVALVFHEMNDYQMAKSAIDIASLSYLIAKQMQLGKEKISEITIAALLHDIGMLRVNSEILQKSEKLKEAEMQAIETHAMYGYDCLTSEFLYPQTLAKIVMQHHEWYNGTGYPSRLSENEIDIGARILACADAFVAMTSHKSYRKKMLSYEAIKALLNDNGTHFDPHVINALIRGIGIYPIGSIVMLSDSSLCRVVQSVPESILRPKLRLLIDPNGSIYGDEENKIVDLQIQKNIFITQAVDPEMVG